MLSPVCHVQHRQKTGWERLPAGVLRSRVHGYHEKQNSVSAWNSGEFLPCSFWYHVITCCSAWDKVQATFYESVVSPHQFDLLFSTGQCLWRLLYADVLFWMRVVPNETWNGPCWHSWWWLLLKKMSMFCTFEQLHTEFYCFRLEHGNLCKNKNIYICMGLRPHWMLSWNPGKIMAGYLIPLDQSLEGIGLFPVISASRFFRKTSSK